MKISTQEFQPVVIVLETPTECAALAAAFANTSPGTTAGEVMDDAASYGKHERKALTSIASHDHYLLYCTLRKAGGGT